MQDAIFLPRWTGVSHGRVNASPLRGRLHRLPEEFFAVLIKSSPFNSEIQSLRGAQGFDSQDLGEGVEDSKAGSRGDGGH